MGRCRDVIMQDAWKATTGAESQECCRLDVSIIYIKCTLGGCKQGETSLFPVQSVFRTLVIQARDAGWRDGGHLPSFSSILGDFGASGAGTTKLLWRAAEGKCAPSHLSVLLCAGHNTQALGCEEAWGTHRIAGSHMTSPFGDGWEPGCLSAAGLWLCPAVAVAGPQLKLGNRPHSCSHPKPR